MIDTIIPGVTNGCMEVGNLLAIKSNGIDHSNPKKL
jgi:hypothetical protein